MNKLVSEALAVARFQVGVREIPRGSNGGPQVEAYLASVGLGEGNPWCAAFVYWCVGRAAKSLGAKNPFIRTGGCAVLSAWAKDHEIREERPQPGDVFLSWSTVAGVYRASHTGFVTDVQGATFQTVEGNTNLDGAREGIGVFQRERSNGSRYKFVRWERLIADAPQAAYTVTYPGRFTLSDLPLRSGRVLCPLKAWAESLNLSLEWNQKHQVALLGGKELPTEAVLIRDRAYAPVRDLAAAAGLRLSLSGHTITLAK